MKNTYSIYLKFGRKFKIPVNPEKIEISYPTNNKTYDVLGIGEIVVPKKPKLKVVSWESFFPKFKDDPYTNSGAENPKAYIQKIEKAMKSKQIGRLIISRSDLYDTNMTCLISKFETTDNGGEPTDIYYSIELQEYKDYTPSAVSIVTTPPAGQTEQAIEVTESQERPVESQTMRVGATVIANGKYWYSSSGSKPFGTANNLNTTVTRIVEGAAYPIHIGTYGWVTADQLQITG